jgi:site-specific DNA-methyltransferase (adenine-specific)
VSAILKEMTIGPCRLILGDGVAVARELSKQWHAVVADPPYGIGFLHSGGGRAKLGIPQTRFVGADFKVLNDDRPFDPRPLLEIAGRRPVVLWGGNHYASRLPDTGGWLAWQKLPDTQLGRLSFSDGEFAWYSWNRRSRFIKHTWSGMTRSGSHAANGKTRFHPTQKPVEIMRWCIEMLPKRAGGWGDTVIDPYMGSGSTAIAAIQAGVNFIGVEMTERWFDVACERVRQYVAATAIPLQQKQSE